MKIGFASTDWSRSIFDKHGMNVPGGANWVRLQQIRPHLDAASATGWLVWNEGDGFGVANNSGDVATNFDVLVLQRIMFKDLADRIEKYREKHPRTFIVNDLDDWYWGLDPRNAAYEMTRPENNPEENIDHYRRIMDLSDLVIVSTPFLKQKLSEISTQKNIEVIENHVATSMFTQRSFTGKQPVIGWVGSTNHRSGDLDELYGMFDNSYKFHHSGHYGKGNPFASALGVSPTRVARSPMRPPWQYAQMSFCFDIGLAPLSDIDFNHAKSWIKLIEYSAAGIPFVASPRSEYKRLVELFGVGRIAETPADWITHIKELQNNEVRIAEGKLLREKVIEHLDVADMAKKWMSVLSSYM